MIGVSYEQILNKIKEEKNLSDEELNSKIGKKLAQLGDLISKEGAAHIVANELGVKVYDNIKKQFKIKELVAGITSVDVVGKVMNVYGVREFKKNDRAGKVGSLLIGDETGVVRVAIWDTNLIKLLEDGMLIEGKVVELKNCYIKENNGFKELHLGNRGSVNFNVNDKIEVRNYTPVNFTSKKINDLKPGENANVTGYVVQLFEPRFYDACPECNKKVMTHDGKGRCDVHGDVQTKKNPVLNFYLDDGSGNIRAVGFRDAAERLMPGINQLNGDPSKFEEIRNEVIGKQFIASGRVVMNEMFNRHELMINNVEEVDATKIIEEVLRE